MLMQNLWEQSKAGIIELDPFDYSAFFPIATFTAGATLPINVNINADSDFVIRYGMIAAYAAGPAFVVNPFYTVTLFDTGSGRALMDQAIHAGSIFGDGRLPFIWPEPKLIKASSVVVVTLTNGDAAAANVFVTFGGFKVFHLSSYQR